MSEAILEMKHIDKSFKNKKVLEDFDLSIQKGEFVIISGPSGCGKSTLLNLMGLLDTPNKGELTLFQEHNVKPFSKKGERILREHIGYVFQNYALIEHESVRYNLELIADKKTLDKNMSTALEKVDLQGYENKKVYECSGGEQQRIALARLYLKPCDLILADEPTGSLDAENRDKVMNLLVEFHNEGKTIVMVTHDETLFPYADRVIKL